MINNSKKTKSGDIFAFPNLKITILDNTGNERTAKLEYNGHLQEVLNKIARIPLPPYINREAEDIDRERYQTVYAEKTGSVAAPTAGLHFTPELLNRLREEGVIFTHITLHVGPGTFLPVRTERIKDHKMHAEYFSISEECCQTINKAKQEGRPITAVGTTTTRVLESIAVGAGASHPPTQGARTAPLQAQSGKTNIFIHPPFTFKIVDKLITNFHLPESTLLMLVSAFAQRQSILNAYKAAITKEYRLFSYGDAMLII